MAVVAEQVWRCRQFESELSQAATEIMEYNQTDRG